MKKLALALGLLLPLTTTLAWGWWVEGHARIAEAAAEGLPDDVPAFFREAGKGLGHLAGDPDRWKNPAARHLRAAEAPNHFLDLEDLGDNALPDDRYKAIALLQRLGRRPETTGLLPYAILESFDRLTCAFADFRADRDNPAIRAKCLVYAGNLAHYTGDLSMPLHTTRNYDGRPGKDGKSEQKGIHAKIDAFPERNGFSAAELRAGLTAHRLDNPWDHVVRALRESHVHVGRCYDLDAAGAFDRPTPESRAFILERCRVGAQLTLDLWYSAWLRSADFPKHY